MSSVDRIPPVVPTMLQAIPSSGVQMRKEGRSQTPDHPKHDVLELHDEEVEIEEESSSAEEIELFPEHGLDLTA